MVDEKHSNNTSSQCDNVLNAFRDSASKEIIKFIKSLDLRPEDRQKIALTLLNECFAEKGFEHPEAIQIISHDMPMYSLDKFGVWESDRRSYITLKKPTDAAISCNFLGWYEHRYLTLHAISDTVTSHKCRLSFPIKRDLINDVAFEIDYTIIVGGEEKYNLKKEINKLRGHINSLVNKDETQQYLPQTKELKVFYEDNSLIFEIEVDMKMKKGESKVIEITENSFVSKNDTTFWLTSPRIIRGYHISFELSDELSDWTILDSEISASRYQDKKDIIYRSRVETGTDRLTQMTFGSESWALPGIIATVSWANQ